VSGHPALLASDAERERTVERLRTGAVDGRLTLEEFAQRMSSAYEARTREELDELTRDLPSDLTPAGRPAKAAANWVVAVMGGAQRRGRFRLATETNVVTIMGGADIDLRQAELEGSDVMLKVYAVMGGANIIVPEGVHVELSGLAIMGGKDHRPGKEPVPPGAPVVHVHAVTLMGGVSVVTKR
jgi:uncharacterized protein DUF1707/cell wall-active antibiotic response 4TMS protein YvqF